MTERRLDWNRLPKLMEELENDAAFYLNDHPRFQENIHSALEYLEYMAKAKGSQKEYHKNQQLKQKELIRLAKERLPEEELRKLGLSK